MIIKYNNKQPFVPFAGYWCNEFFYDCRSIIRVQSLQMYSSNTYNAHRLYCNSSGDATASYINPNYALPVRGVYNKYIFKI